MNVFEFYRLRFHLRAIDPVRFPAGKSANLLRGAFGLLLRESASATAYSRIFEPVREGGRGPSGLSDSPRPFVLRASHLDGITILPGGQLWFDLHLFDVRRPELAAVRGAFERLAREGLGPGRGRAALERVDQLDAEDGACTIGDVPGPPSAIALAPPADAERVRLWFVTPTEIKSEGEAAGRPEFRALMARVRDRIANLCALYGRGPLELDYRGMGERAATVRLARCEISWERTGRRSSRTGQTHPLGGFTGEVEYEGPLGEFLPWLQAARWAGVGRQTVWGKGDVRVVSPRA